ncbi:MAG: tRNA lysidine(34) synthetase TilS [Cytophagia bacterium]|nr:tRNA lysidine(34) synthetase TilS [Cytophagia bacterium]
MKTKDIELYFNHFFKKEMLDKNKKYLLAVSGGVDSMVLLNLFQVFNFNFSVCSCNFLLRSRESDEDVLLVKTVCDNNNIKFYKKSFETKIYSKENNISIQMASRDLRYEWFNELLEKNNYDFIVTAHHRDDNIETILFNFIKTTGYKGIAGIKKKSKNLIRPLLDIDKKDLISYAKIKKLQWREDKSNEDNKYSRNKIRNKVIPLLSEINDSLGKSIIESTQRINKVEEFVGYYLNDFKKKYVNYSSSFIEVNKSFLNNNYYELLIYDFLRVYGFNYDQISQFIKIIRNNNNQKFYSKEYTLCNDRYSFFIVDSDIQNKVNFQIKSLGEVCNNGIKLSISKYDKQNFTLNNNSSNAQLDYDKVLFPLTLRNYRKGEKFIPLGMKKHKKISSFLSDSKVSWYAKNNQFIIEDSNKKIIWVVGHQISDEYKVESSTKRVLDIEII